MWQIGRVSVSNRLIAAPLAGISNPVYRQLMHEAGAGLVYSEMISDKALHYQSRKTFDMCRTVPGEHPLAMQLFGSDPDTMGEAAQYLTEHTDCDIIDINMGCPVPKVVKGHAGSWLMQDPALASDIVKAVVDHTDRPVTVKIRAGWDAAHINCDTFAAEMEKAGVSAIAVHGRTRTQLYEGKSDPEYIRRVKESVSVPVIGNGDIRTADDIIHMLETTKCDAVMIGRGLLGRPFFLREAAAALNGESYAEPDYEERIAMALEYARRLSASEGEDTGMRMMRSMGAWYITGMPHSSSVRSRMSTVKTYTEMESLLKEYLEQLRAYV